MLFNLDPCVSKPAHFLSSETGIIVHRGFVRIMNNGDNYCVFGIIPGLNLNLLCIT